MEPIYLDYNATCPIAPEVLAEMQPYLADHYGNPSSAHVFGQRAKQAIDKARNQLAVALGVGPDEIIFTGGGTEANNTAIRGVAMALRERGRHLVTTTVEHPAVTEVMRFLQQEGWEVSFVPVDGDGQVDPADIEKAIRKDTVLVSAMHANNELGTVLPVGEIARVAHEKGVLVHTDAAQSVGKIPARMPELGVDLLSVAGHKFYAPKGVGALVVKAGTPFAKLMFGADHESDRRPGTENTPYLVGLGAAARLAVRDLKKNMTHYRAMRDRLEQALVGGLPALAVKVNGPADSRLPNTLSISFANVQADSLLYSLPEIAAGTGAACHAGGVSLSSVLQAIGLPMRFAKGTVRLTTGRATTAEEIDRAAELILAAVQKMQR